MPIDRIEPGQLFVFFHWEAPTLALKLAPNEHGFGAVFLNPSAPMPPGVPFPASTRAISEENGLLLKQAVIVPELRLSSLRHTRSLDYSTAGAIIFADSECFMRSVRDHQTHDVGLKTGEVGRVHLATF